MEEKVSPDVIETTIVRENKMRCSAQVIKWQEECPGVGGVVIFVEKRAWD